MDIIGKDSRPPVSQTRQTRQIYPVRCLSAISSGPNKPDRRKEEIKNLIILWMSLRPPDLNKLNKPKKPDKPKK